MLSLIVPVLPADSWLRARPAEAPKPLPVWTPLRMSLIASATSERSSWRHCGDVVGERALEGGHVVPRADRHGRSSAGILAARPGTGPGLRRDTDVDRVVPTIVVTEEFDHSVAARRGPCDPDCGVNGLATGVRERRQLGARNGPAHRLAEIGLEPVRCPVTEARFELPADRVQDDMRRMSEQQGAEGERVVDVFVAVDIDDPRPRAPLEADRNGQLRCAKRCGNAAGERLASSLLVRDRTGKAGAQRAVTTGAVASSNCT
jgi:hypothetical protein